MLPRVERRKAPPAAFRSRSEAGSALAAELRHYAGRSDVVVLALPRGGVPVGFQVARSLAAPLDVLLVRKIGMPGQEELGAGALASGGIRVINREIAAHADAAALAAVEARERQELERRSLAYRGQRPAPALEGRVVVLVDDGLATGATMEAAVLAVRTQRPARVVVAVPVGAIAAIERVRRSADEVVCPLRPEPLRAIGNWYKDFRQVSDAAVRELLDRAWARGAEASPAAREVLVSNGVELSGTLLVPPQALGLVVFVHGSGSGRHSERNQHVARSLNAAHLATFLFDLLTPEEQQIDAVSRQPRFDIDRLTGRVLRAVDWAREQPETRSLKIGLFGASTGAAAALRAAAERPAAVRAVVSRGGRADLTGTRLADVQQPVLLIVGSRDAQVLEQNREALAALPGSAELRVVAGATHLFSEPGALDEVSRLTAAWFCRHLAATGA